MVNERIESQRKKYDKIYTDLVFCYDDLKQMLDSKEINKRSFINKIDTLKEYMDFLDKLEKEVNNKRGFFAKLLKRQDDIDYRINSYLTDKKLMDLEKLEKCSKCKCINCISECKMTHCYNCREKEYVKECDKKEYLLTTSSDKVTLYQGDEEFIFNVAGYLVEKDCEGNFYRYVYLVDIKDYDNQHILKYYKFKGEEHYESVIEDDNQDNLIRINDKFIEMGLRV